MDSRRKMADEKNISKSKEMRKKVKNAESTALKRYKLERYIIEDLGKVLNDVYFLFQPVPADYDARKDLVKALNAMAKDIYGNSEENSPVLEAYGSFMMDMFSRHSDLDVSINFGNKTSELSRDEKLKILRKFAEKLCSLEGQGFVRNVVSIYSARVPIVKFFDQGAAVECDLSVENKGGILNSEIIRIISQIDERFQKLCMLVKLWAKAQEVNSALYGTLNSVSITLLVAHHLQTLKPPILPPFSTLFKDGIDPPKVEKITEKFVNWGQRNKESLGRLFTTFFIKLQSVEFLWRQGLCVSVLNGLWIYKKRKNVRLGSICVEDFTDVSQNVARRVSVDGVKKIYSSISRTVDDIIEFLNGEVSERYLRSRLFGQQAVVERHPPVPPLDGEIAGTHLKHSLVSQQAVAEPPPPPVRSVVNGKIAGIHLKHGLYSHQAVVEPPPPVPLHNGNVTETDRRDRLFGKQAVMEPPPPLPSLNGRIAGTHLNHRLFGQPAAVERPPPVPRFDDNIAGTHMRHGVFGQPAAMERPPPVPRFEDHIAGTHMRHGVFGQPAAMERPPPVPRFEDNIAGTHMRHGVFGQPTAMERPPPVPRFEDNIVGTHLRHGSFGQPAAMERPPPVPRFDDNIAGTHLRHGVFGQPAAIDRRPPPVPRFDDNIAGTHMRHGSFGQPAVMERPPPVPRFEDNIAGTHLRHGSFGQPAGMERPPPVPHFDDKIAGTHQRHGPFTQPAAMERPPPVPSLNVYPQQSHNNNRNGFSSPPEVQHNKRVCLENGYRAEDGMSHSREEERRYEDLRNRYAGNYNTFEEFGEVPRFGIHNNQVPLNGHLVHHRHDGRLSGEEQMTVSHWQDYSRRIGPPSPRPRPPYGRVPVGPPKFHEPPYIRRPRFTRRDFAQLG